VRVVEVTSPRQLRVAEQLLKAGAGSLVLIWSPTCPHCHTYMPLWKELTKMSNKQTNMISVRSDMYPELSLSEKKSVEGVPTVLYVNSEGRIQEVEDSRNKARMTALVTTPRPSTTPTMPAISVKPLTNLPPLPPVSARPSPATAPAMGMSNVSLSPVIPSALPGTKVEPSALNIIPGGSVSNILTSEAMQTMVPEQPVGSAVQKGGNFSGMIRAAGPAALLLGAYAAFGRTRSSGLPPASRRRRRSASRRRSRRGRSRKA
jgi:hypothetical protein